MKKTILSFVTIALLALGANAQESTNDECCTQDEKGNKGDWYVGTGNIADLAWTQWSVSPTLGYGVTDNLMVGLNLSQANSDTDFSMDLHARYFLNVVGQDLFVYLASDDVTNLDTKDLSVGVGKFFTLHKGVYVDPKITFNLNEKTTNLQLGFGLKF
jgi:hypothetical protein|tara:strand:+ start:874 stop:1347 length:474 start_codon:yes stop_codon:yes gene_type:complete